MFVSLDEVLDKYIQLLSKIFVKLWQLLKVLFDKFVIFLLRMIHYHHQDPIKAIDIIFRSSNFVVVNKINDILITSNDKSKVKISLNIPESYKKNMDLTPNLYPFRKQCNRY